MQIRFGFPGEHPGYHAYEALQIFNDAKSFPELVPMQDGTWLSASDGETCRVIDVPEFDNPKLLKQFLYDTMSELTGYRSPWGCMTGIRPAKIANQLMNGGKSAEEAQAFLQDFYRITPEKARLTVETALVQKPFLAGQAGHPERIGVYLGIPFCPTRCLYCSFPSNSIVKYKKSVDAYLSLLSEEMKGTAELIREKGLEVESVYLGGGTPTSLSEPQFERYLQDVVRNFIADNPYLKEFSLEAGRPDSITAGKLDTARACGVTRISVNPQTMNDATLRLIGRCHTSRQVEDAFALAREKGFSNINMDLIAGLPGEDLTMFQHTLDRIAALRPDAVTVHTLSVKRAADLKRDERRELLQSRIVGEMVSAAQARCRELGMRSFYMYRQKNMLGNHENAAYCLPGKESPYNIHIMEEDQTILALGAGGVSKRVAGNRIERAFNVKSVEDYMARSGEMLERKRGLMEKPL